MRNKNIVTFLVLFLIFCFCAYVSCAAALPQTGTSFYDGLKTLRDSAEALAESDTTVQAVTHFENALESSNTHIAAAAAAELMMLHSTGTEISATVMGRIRRKAAGSWAAAFDALGDTSSGVNRDKALALLLNGENRLLNEAAHYVLREWRGNTAGSKTNGETDNSADSPANNAAAALTEAENAAIDGRVAVSRFSYNEALGFFRVVIRDSPELFFRYPDLLTDLGRTFQYTATGREGIRLFLEWEANLTAGNDTGQIRTMREAVIPGNENLIRFHLLFFAARIARQRGEPCIELFAKALPFAPQTPADSADACIWYILDSSLAQGPEQTIRYLETFISQWHSDAYFSDIMDKLTRELVVRRQWKNIASVSELLRRHSGAAEAHYAWITARLIEEGFFSPDDSAETAQAYKRIAYDAAGKAAVAAGNNALYYRFLSAAALDEHFLSLPETSAPEKKTAINGAAPEAMQFLLGFFENDAAEFAPRYIRPLEGGLAPDDLRRLAAVLGGAGRYQESMRLVSLYTGRDSYQIERQDLELLYPQPFKELVEQHAAEAGIESALLYGLIRTESAFNPVIVSRSGAVGLTQLMPATAEETAARIRRNGGPDYTSNENIENDSFDYLRDPDANIHIGTAYFAYLNGRMEDTLLALLAYNGGMTRVRRWRGAADRLFGVKSGSLPPDLFLETVEYPETRNYGRSVMAAAAVYRELYYQRCFVK